MKYLQYALISILGFLFAGCSDAFTPESNTQDDNARVVGDKVILSSSIDVSEFREVTTRAFTEAPNLNNLNLYIIEFVDNGSPLTNTLSAVYRPSKETVEGTVVKYDVTINKTDQPRILHFLALADNNLQIPNGVESSVMPGLISINNQDAYWRRLSFPKGYCIRETYDGNKERWVINQDLKDKLVGDGVSGPKNVKLVRNFAKVTVGIDPNVTLPNDGNSTGFTLEGFIVVNTPLKGTMVPYSSTGSQFPEFLDAAGNPLPYQTVAQSYAGISPANTTLANQVTSQDAPDIPTEALTRYSTTENGAIKNWDCLPSQYLYERPFNSISRTYVIVKGTYHNRVTNSTDKSTYYKLDFGGNDSNGIFRYYGLLRNYNFFIRITGIATNGYDSAQAAAEGTVYNNISFDIDTDHLLNMSDGSDVIKVNMTTAVITDNDSILDFRYYYKSNIIAGNGTFNNSYAKFIDLKPGAVIKSVTPNDPNTATDITIGSVKWRDVKIACKNPTTIAATQEFTVVNPSTGLGRTITLVSHLKWDFENLREYAGIWENYPSAYQGLQYENQSISLNDGTYRGLCGTNELSQFTIFFDIPDNIPEALFPLEFIIESDLQGLENEPMGTIVVSPGPSLFPDNNGENRIQYRKSVTWTEYNSELKMNVRDDNGTAIGDPANGPVTHRVRCRFRTIETVTNNTKVTVAIDNINFNKTFLSFNRVSGANGLTGPGLVLTPAENP